MSYESRFRKLEDKLATLGFDETLRAVDLVKAEMNAEKGFTRHDGSDYYYHPADVTLLLLDGGIKDEPTLTAGVTHDLAEDVDGFTIETMRHLFSAEAAEAVRALTKIEGVDYKNIANLKAYYVPILLDWRTSLVKAADIMHNMSTLHHASREKILRKLIEAREVYLPFLKEARKKYPRFANFFYFAKFTVEAVINSYEKAFGVASSEDDENAMKVEF